MWTRWKWKTGNTDLLALLAASARKPEIASDTGAFRRSHFARGKKSEELQPRVDEFLVFSSEGQLLHDWQSAEAEGRARLLGSLAEKARQLAQMLPVGEFNRLEVNGPKARLVAIIEREQSVFVRTSRNPGEKL